MSGWIILDKSSGLFSRTATNRVARLFGLKKSGHIGTLDPMATGVLPIALGDATKMIPFVEGTNDGIKEYLFSLQFGHTTDTLDITGTTTATNGRANKRCCGNIGWRYQPSATDLQCNSHQRATRIQNRTRRK